MLFNETKLVVNKDPKMIAIFRVIIYIISILSAGVAICAAYFANPLATNMDVSKFLQLAALLFIGWQHIKLTNAFHLKIVSPLTNNGLSATCIFSLALILVLWILKYSGIITPLLSPVIAGAAFLLPSVVNKAFNVFQYIPDLQLQPWYKRDNLIDNKSFIFLSSIPIHIKLQTKVLDTTYTNFTSTVPGHFELGKIFHYFLIQQQINHEVIETNDDDGEPYGWNFYLENKWLPMVTLDSDKNLVENNVKSNVTIIAKRIMPPSAFLFQPTIKNISHELHQ